MNQASWILLDTETSGLKAPIHALEIGAQKMLGFKADGPSFRMLINHGIEIPDEAAAINGLTKERLEREGAPAIEVYEKFAQYAGGLPLCAYNLPYDLDMVLLPEWSRLEIAPIGARGFCVLALARRLLDPVPTGSCKLQTLREHYGLPDRGAHTALGDVETTIDLLEKVLEPLCKERGLNSWEDVVSFVEAQWYPVKFSSGEFKGRSYKEAMNDTAVMDWLLECAESDDEKSSKMANWYLDKLEESILRIVG